MKFAAMILLVSLCLALGCSYEGGQSTTAAGPVAGGKIGLHLTSGSAVADSTEMQFKGEKFFIENRPLITEKDIKDVALSQMTNGEVYLVLNAHVQKEFHGKKAALLLDGKPVATFKIREGDNNEGITFSCEDAEETKSLFKQLTGMTIK